MYRGRIGWVSSKVIERLISLVFAPRNPITGNLVQGDHPQNSGGIVVVAVFSRKPAISVKRGKIGPRLLLMTNRKLHTCFRLLPKSMTLGDLERPLRTPLQKTCRRLLGKFE